MNYPITGIRIRSSTVLFIPSSYPVCRLSGRHGTHPLCIATSLFFLVQTNYIPQLMCFCHNIIQISTGFQHTIRYRGSIHGRPIFVPDETWIKKSGFVSALILPWKPLWISVRLTVKSQIFVRYPFSYFWLETGSFELIFIVSRASKQNDAEIREPRSKKKVSYDINFCTFFKSTKVRKYQLTVRKFVTLQ